MNVTEHLIQILGEECAETALDCSKANRFGLKDRNIEVPNSPTNLDRLIVELNDLLGVAQLCVEAGILPPNWQRPHLQELKKERVRKYMRYAYEETETLSPGNDLRDIGRLRKIIGKLPKKNSEK